jgi:dihydroflavonol-4-reductase
MIVDYLQGRMPAYLETGLNLIHVRDVARGHLLAEEKGRVGEKYILGNQNLSLSEIFQMLAEITGIPAPRVRLPLLAHPGPGLCQRILGLVPQQEAPPDAPGRGENGQKIHVL